MEYLLLILVVFIFTIGYAISSLNYVGGKIFLNGFLMISFGFIFYLLLPVIFYCYIEVFFTENRGLAGVYSYLPDTDSMIMFCIIFYLSFISLLLGYLMLPTKQSQSYNKFADNNYRAFYLYFLKFICVICICFLSVIAFFIRGQFFRGYTILTLNQGISSTTTTFIALTNMLFVFSAMYSIIQNQNSRAKNFLLEPFMVISYGFMLLSISLGGRMAVASSLVALIVICTKFYSFSFSPKSLFLSGVFASCFMGLLGLLRMGAGGGISDIYLNVISDPIYTAITLFSFIKQNTTFALLSFPKEFLGGFLNLIPSLILPNKVNLMPSIFDMGYRVEAPLGALNVFVSMIVNFGIVGTIIVFFFIGLILAYFEKRASSTEMVLIGCFIVGFVGFDFFRNPFSLSVVKNMFQTSFLQPLLLFKLTSILYHNDFKIYKLKREG